MHHYPPKWKPVARATFALGCVPPWRHATLERCACRAPSFAVRLGWLVLPLAERVRSLGAALRAVEKMMGALGYGRVGAWKRAPAEGKGL